MSITMKYLCAEVPLGHPPGIINFIGKLGSH